MQKEKKRKVILIVGVIALLAIIVTVGTVSLCQINKNTAERQKREYWYSSSYDTKIVIEMENTIEGTIEVSLKDVKEYHEKNDVAIVEFNDDDITRGNITQIKIVNEGVVIREMATPSELYEKDIARREKENVVYDNVGCLDYSSFLCKIYKNAEDDSLQVYKIIEIRVYYHVSE